MTIAIYYFSGTGNSLSVARDIATATGATLHPIAAVVAHDTISPDSEVIGLVFPVYYGELPVIIKRFAEKLTGIESKYIFAVCTFGGSAGYSLKILKRLIRERGGEIAATYQVHMPQNSFLKRWERHNVLYSSWKKKLGRVVSNTNKRRRGDFFRHFFLAPFFLLTDYIVHLMKPSYRKAFIKLSNASPELATDELIHLNDTSYRADERCNGCGLCAKICPVNNIEMADDRPVWLHHCENCLACYNWCPTKAIRGGIAAEGYYYRHPDVKATEIMAQRSQPR
ncbi:MAG: EFR1 family ferrodoxin [Dehalococcoidia bacterium]|jgi:ferredoxin/flavodoxin